MDWKTLGQKLAALGLPLLGAALPIPGGAAIGTALASVLGSEATPESILSAVQSNTDAMQKAREFELTHQETMLKLQLDYERDMRQADSADVAQVNTTMQAEAKSENWWQSAWRPYNGFLYGTTIFMTYFMLPVCKVTVPVIPTEVWIGWGAVLGVTAWFRGSAQVAEAKK